MFKHISPVPCVTRVLISAGSTTVGGKLYTFTKCKPTLSGRAGFEMQGGRKGVQKYEEMKGFVR